MLNSKKKNLFDNHWRTIRFRMNTYLINNNVAESFDLNRMRTKDIMNLFIEHTGINVSHIEGKMKVRDYLIDLYRSGECQFLPAPGYGFYLSKEWLRLRKKILIRWGNKCMKCLEYTDFPHVDHIKPKSKYPDLALEESNLQILCRKCNIGKSNRDETDYRPVFD